MRVVYAECMKSKYAMHNVRLPAACYTPSHTSFLLPRQSEQECKAKDHLHDRARFYTFSPTGHKDRLGL